jgi:hypothetical protein
MKILLVIWRASLRSTSNTMRQDGRMRIALLIGLLFQVISGIWAITHLVPLFASWRIAGAVALQQHLWLTCLFAWLPICLFAVLSSLMSGLTNSEALLLATQPIAPATRLRALYGLILLKGVANWLLFEASITGIALVLVLGWSALLWLLLLVVGAALASWCALIATLLILRFVLPHLRRILVLCSLLTLVLTALALAAHFARWHFLAPAQPRALAATFARLFAPVLAALTFAWPFLPVLALSCFLLLLFLALVPLAAPSGRLYLSALQSVQGRDNASQARALPGVGLLGTLFSRSRTLTAALLVKGLLNQSRSLFAWMRLLALAMLIAFFPLFRPSLAVWHLPQTVQVAGYASLLAFLMLIEYAPYAISSEGNRLALYLVIPHGLSAFVRARLVSFLLPTLLVGLSSTLLLGLWTGLAASSLLAAVALVLLMLLGYICFTVLGSALDANLTIVVEDRMQALMQEEVPITPRRLQLLALTVALFSAMLWLAWKLPLVLALPTLALLDVATLLLMWRMSLAYIARLLH